MCKHEFPIGMVYNQLYMKGRQCGVLAVLSSGSRSASKFQVYGSPVCFWESASGICYGT
jgi:hypothetical protein